MGEEENIFLSRAPRSPIIKKKNKATSVYRLFLQVKYRDVLQVSWETSLEAKSKERRLNLQAS